MSLIVEYLKSNREKLIHYSIFFIIFLFILISNPFLRYPYDMYHHLIRIDRYDTITVIPLGREAWHFIWAKILHFLAIPTSEIFLRAKIIHITQTLIAFLSIFYFSKIAIRNIFKSIDKNRLFYLSLWSTITWFVIFATYSVHYHLVWNLWYSVNYQITLPLFWYMTALTLQLFWEEKSYYIKAFYIVQILILARIILQIHSMEFLYYLMYLCVFAVFYIKNIVYIITRYFYISVPIILSIGYFIKNYQPEHSAIFNYFSIEKLPILWQRIEKEGGWLIGGFNRSSAAINELMYLIGILGVIALILVYIFKTELYQDIDKKKFLFFITTALFLLIPLYQYSAGLFSVITRWNVTNRFYYSSSIFLLFPVFVYIIQRYFRKTSLKTFNILMVILFVLIFSYSKYFDTLHHNFYKNIQSIYDSVFTTKYSFHLNDQQIKKIGDIIQKIESKQYQKPIRYYARADIVFVIKYIYRKPVFYYKRRANPDYIQKYEEAKHQKDLPFTPILIEIPKGFPPLNMYY